MFVPVVQKRGADSDRAQGSTVCINYAGKLTVCIDAVMSPSPAPSILSDNEKFKSEDLRLENAMSPDPDAARPRHGDAALEILGTSSNVHEITVEQDRAVLRKIDLWVLPVSHTASQFSIVGLSDNLDCVISLYVAAIGERHSSKPCSW